MDDFINKMKNNIILSNQDINLLRNAINKEHPQLDESSKARILARNIHNILNKNLKGFTKDYKSNVKNNLIKNTFLSNRKIIYQYDVLKACAANQDTSLEFIYQINKWISTQIDEEIDLNIIKNIIQELSVEPESITYNDTSLSKILEENDKNIKEKKHDNIKENYNNSSDNKTISDDECIIEDENLNDNKEISSKCHVKVKPIIKYIAKLKNKILYILETNMSDEETRKYILIYSLALCLLLIPITHIFKNYIYKDRAAFIELVTSAEYNNINLEFEDNDYEISKDLELMTSHLPDHFKYKRINEKELRNYLIEKNSLLAKEPYFSTIIKCAKEFNLNPILLFSIAGHEQAFVPKNHKFAKKIANNPYNVFKSWENYNTNIVDSSRIASRTVINLLKGRPENEDPFKWINRKYAQDKKWWKGVKEIYSTLEKKSGLKVNIDGSTKANEKVYFDPTN